MYSIIVFICSTGLAHAECQANTATDVVRGPTVENEIMCGLNAQTVIARTNLVKSDGTEYVKIVCARTNKADEWIAEIEARKAGQ